MKSSITGALADRRTLLTGTPAALVAAALEPAGAATRSIEEICRDAWGAAPPTGPYLPQTVNAITLHHSGTIFRDNRTAPATFRSFQADHQSRGWVDIAYHVLIDRHGNIYRGRPPHAVGDSNTAYDYVGHLLVMCVGNFQTQKIPKPQLAAAVDVCTWAAAKWDVDPATIDGHRDETTETVCPGDNFEQYISDGTIRRRVRRRLRSGGVHMVHLCGAAGRRRVRRIENGTD